MKLFALRDLKSNLFLTPNFQRSIADATRSFSSMVNDSSHPNMITQFPGDFRLYHLADFDSETGKLTVLDLPQDLGCALDFMAPDKQSVLPFMKQQSN